MFYRWLKYDKAGIPDGIEDVIPIIYLGIFQLTQSTLIDFNHRTIIPACLWNLLATSAAIGGVYNDGTDMCTTYYHRFE